ncbi:MAG: hypothetical protein Kow0077_05260 [Anaerolineae bacterium]
MPFYGHSPRVRAVIHHDGRFLLAQHNNRRPENMGKWGTPGGRVEHADPDLQEALRREIREEFEIEVTVIGWVGTYEYKKREHHVFLVHPHSTQFVIDADEILAYGWFTLAQVRQLAEEDRLHTGFELDAIERSLALLARRQR